MTSSRQRDIEIFAEAIRLPVEQRSDFLSRACADDAGRRRRVEALLQPGERANRLPEAPPAGAMGEERPRSADSESLGSEVGPYRLLQKISEGEFGIMFLAEQVEPTRRRVAFKLMKLDFGAGNSRFEAEWQRLALLEHPSIAPVLDAGVTRGGRTYFVTEWIEGLPITDYCDRHALSVPARLELFAQVCEAIQYAHQNGIIHRALKPSNVLVSAGSNGEPMPKVIDYGLTETTAGERWAEPANFAAWEYLSPEQVALTGAPVDTRTDIYSLGALLYELLTGSTPFLAREMHNIELNEVRRMICEEKLVPPSARLRAMMAGDFVRVSKHEGMKAPQLLRDLRGDLDWIVMKALEKDRSRRYATVDGLAMDVRRYLSGQAVSAHPPSAGYRWRKRIAGHKLVFAGVALLLAVLVLGLTLALGRLRNEKQVSAQVRQQAEVDRLEIRAWQFHAQRRYAESEEVFRQALALRRQLPGSEPASLTVYTTCLAIFKTQKQLEKIRPFLMETVDRSRLTKAQMAQVFTTGIRLLAQRARWKDAAILAEELRQSDLQNPEHYHLLAPLLAALNETGRYRELCVQIMAQFHGTTDPFIADRMGKDCLILPASGVDYRAVAALADLAVSKGGNEVAAPFFQFCKALAEFRLNHYEEAAKWAEIAIRGRLALPQAEARAVLAMAQFQLKQEEQARATLAACNQYIDEKLPKAEPGETAEDDWRDWIIARALQAEAAQMIADAPGSANPSR